MADDNLFRTSRMNVMRGANLMFMPGEIVYLQRRVQEFARGTEVKVISVQAVRPGEYRYQILIGEKKMWAFESDLRHTAPSEGGTGPQDMISSTQRMQTLTLSQRMSSLAANARPNPAGPASAAQRMHNSTQEERLQKMLQTNRMRTLGAMESNSVMGTEAAAPTPPANPAVPPIKRAP
jgi:hypothetical protein